MRKTTPSRLQSLGAFPYDEILPQLKSELDKLIAK